MKNIFINVLILIITFVVAELALSLVVNYVPAVNEKFYPGQSKESQTISDPVLQKKPNPNFPEHDSWGYRNKEVPKQADVIIFGDSQSYGTSVSREEAWPALLNQKHSTYNMASPGWAAIHSIVLLEQALKLKPKVVIQTVYAGNDNFDTFKMVYLGNDFSFLRSQNQAQIQEIIELEKEKPLYQVAQDLSQKSARSFYTAWKREQLKENKKFYESFKLYELGRKTLGLFGQENYNEQIPWGWSKNFVNNHSDYFSVFEEGKIKSILTPPYRAFNLNQNDLRIKESIRIQKLVLKRLSDLLKKEKIKFVVAFVPTKEFCFANVKSTKALEKNLVYEKAFWKDLESFLASKNIEFVDLSVFMIAALKAGKQVYFQAADGHPTVVGHELIAENIDVLL